MKPRLIVVQKITAFANRYMIYKAAADGSRGELVALAQQKRLAFREKVTFYNDEAKTQVVFSFRAEKVMDIHGRYFVEDPTGSIIGGFKKEFAKSLVNSTWNILDKNGKPKITVSESNQALAILRRFGSLIPIVGIVIEIVTAILRYHFEFTNTVDGKVIGRYEKTKIIRDHYRLSMTDEAYSAEDWRVIASIAVALDALQSR